MEDESLDDLEGRIEEGTRIGGKLGYYLVGVLGAAAVGYFGGNEIPLGNSVMQGVLDLGITASVYIPTSFIGEYAGKGVGALIGAGYHALTRIGKSPKKRGSRAFEDVRVNELMSNEDL